MNNDQQYWGPHIPGWPNLPPTPSQVPGKGEASWWGTWTVPNWAAEGAQPLGAYGISLMADENAWMQWSSPVFDLAPMLKGAMGERPQGVTVGRPGATLKLQLEQGTTGIQISGGDASMRVLCVEYAALVDPKALTRTMYPQDITGDYYDGGFSVVLNWAPQVGVRYWQTKLLFTRINDGGASPVIRCRGAMY